MKRTLPVVFGAAVLAASPAHAQFGELLNSIRQIRGTVYEVNGAIREAKGTVRDATSTVKEASTTFTDLCSTLGVSCNEQRNSRPSEVSRGQGADLNELNKIYGAWYRNLARDER